MPRLKSALVVSTGKGGVGKTSITANLGVMFARMADKANGKVLLVDLDPQGNLTGHEFGLEDHDEGSSLVKAVCGRQPSATPISTGRERLDIIPGGGELIDLPEMMLKRAGSGGIPDLLYRALQPVAQDYDIVLIDTPPATGILPLAALGVGTWCLVPTRTDGASVDAVMDLIKLAREAGGDQDMIRLLGVVLFASQSSATSLRREVRAQFTDSFGALLPVLDTFIRYAERAASDGRSRGLTAVEYGDQSLTLGKPFWERTEADETPTFSSAASSLSEDYAALCDEVCNLLCEKATV